MAPELSAADLISEVVKQLTPILRKDQPKFDEEKFAATMATAIVNGLREGQRDPIKEKRTAQMKERGQLMARQNLKEKIAREKRCSHMRSFPYQGLSKIAWAVQSDGVKRGYCPDCDSCFYPGHPMYEKLVVIQTSPLLEGNVV